jgi:hypothetical protein
VGFVVEIILPIVGVLLCLSVLYAFLPHKALSPAKPKIAFFPKYVVNIQNLHTVLPKLQDEGFKPSNYENTFVRGSYFGDFFTKLIKLSVTVKQDKAYLQSPLIVILFDTGDLWSIGKSLEADA